VPHGERRRRSSSPVVRVSWVSSRDCRLGRSEAGFGFAWTR
jgi:hypothetical protein